MPLLMNNAEEENKSWERKGHRNCRNSKTLIKFLQIKTANTNIPKQCMTADFQELMVCLIKIEILKYNLII